MSRNSSETGDDTRDTEYRDPRFQDLAIWPRGQILSELMQGQRRAIDAVEQALPDTERAVGAALGRLEAGRGRLIYAGAGTSGRLGLLDGVELLPTFNWPPERLVTLLAGGAGAVQRSVEGAEDSADAARRDIADINLTTDDVVIGVAASGSTPFTRQVLQMAKKAGALTIAIVNNTNSPMLQDAQIGIVLESGPEVLAGSTRMAAGTSQKAALNLFSTSLMIGLNKVHDGYMVDMVASNAKLRQRAVNMVCAIAECSPDEASEALVASEYKVKIAILVVRGLDIDRAVQLLENNQGNLGACLLKIRQTSG